MADDVVISMDGAWKRYGTSLGRELLRSLRPGRRGAPPSERDGPWALHDVSFQVRRGEVLGVIGTNGAGKSTLLKVLAGVSPLSHGSFQVRGRLFSMIELNAGIHNELTGRQNVYLLGAFMGLSRGEMRRRMPEIEEFCELGEFFDRPVRTYSSGMLARLGFAVAVNVDADVLLVDEVLAVGDLGFQKKCFDRLERIRKGGATIVFVSHSLRQVQRICDRVLWLDGGAIRQRGDPVTVVREYCDHAIVQRTPDPIARQRQGIWRESGEMAVLAVTTLDRSDKHSATFATLESFKIRVEYTAFEPLADLIFGFNVYSSDMVLIHSFISPEGFSRLAIPQGTGRFTCTIPELRLLPGFYFLSIRIKDKNSRTVSVGEQVANFSVRPTPETQILGGLVFTPTQWQWELRASAAA